MPRVAWRASHTSHTVVSLAHVAVIGFAACQSKKAANVLNRWWSERSERNLRIGYLLTSTLVLEEGEHK